MCIGKVDFENNSFFQRVKHLNPNNDEERLWPRFQFLVNVSTDPTVLLSILHERFKPSSNVARRSLIGSIWRSVEAKPEWSFILKPVVHAQWYQAVVVCISSLGPWSLESKFSWHVPCSVSQFFIIDEDCLACTDPLHVTTLILGSNETFLVTATEFSESKSS